MSLTIQEEKERKNRSAKLLLYFAIVSMFMMFAGLTSAYIVSASRKDWNQFSMPTEFIISTIIIFMSSLSFQSVLNFTKNNNRNKATLMLIVTLILGLLFVLFQFQGYKSLIKLGLYFTGSESTITATFLYIISGLHLIHLFAGLISLLVVIYNHFKQKYNSLQTIGLELSIIFWHFLDILWILLFLFLYFV